MAVDVKDILDNLENELVKLKNSDEFKNYLKCMSKFPQYSYNNSLLIMSQMPEATLVAGFQSWEKNFDRHVKKGEKGIKILAPCPVKKYVMQDKLDADGNNIRDSTGKRESEMVEITIPRFKPVTVFDVSQTEGEPIAELTVNELTADVESYDNFKKALYESSEVSISEEDIKTGAKGFYSPSEDRIVIKKDMPQAQTIKTIIHEMAHSKLHRKDIPKEDRRDRNTKEVEAESIAYTVCSHFGINTDDYSFGYILGWSKDASLDEFRDSLQRIQRTSNQLIGRIETELIKQKELVNDKGIKDKLIKSKQKVTKDHKQELDRKGLVIS